MNLALEYMQQLMEYASAFNPDSQTNTPIRQLIEAVIPDMPERYLINDKLRFTRSRARGFDTMELILPWMDISGQLILTIDCKPTEGPPGFGGRVPAVVLTWKTAIHNDNPLDPLNSKAQPMWIVTSIQLVPLHRYFDSPPTAFYPLFMPDTLF